MTKTSSVRAVIGSGYGDEGKGLLTDALSCHRTRVVRFNGGAQAGHTVETPEGHRHVFHHVGAGTFRGASTHLSKFFVINPILALREVSELYNLGLIPSITADPRAPITTPVDMMINQALEDQRGAKRHGSCGIGFGETLERTEKGGPDTHICMADLCAEMSDLYAPSGMPASFADKLDNIYKNWALQRCEELGLDYDSLPYDDCIQEQFRQDCLALANCHIELLPDESIAEVPEIVFEGAQGLGLDQDLGDFPHVTRSNTGLKNVASLMRASDIDLPLTVYYATRVYATRHGAGPLEGEGALTRVPEDRTNQQNQWQGSLRYAHLDVKQRFELVDKDLMEDPGLDVHPYLAITCLDHIPELSPTKHPLLGDYSHGKFADRLAESMDLYLAVTSYGPTRQTLCWVTS